MVSHEVFVDVGGWQSLKCTVNSKSEVPRLSAHLILSHSNEFLLTTLKTLVLLEWMVGGV